MHTNHAVAPPWPIGRKGEILCFCAGSRIRAKHVPASKYRRQRALRQRALRALVEFKLGIIQLGIKAMTTTGENITNNWVTLRSMDTDAKYFFAGSTSLDGVPLPMRRRMRRHVAQPKKLAGPSSSPPSKEPSQESQQYGGEIPRRRNVVIEMDSSVPGFQMDFVITEGGDGGGGDDSGDDDDDDDDDDDGNGGGGRRSSSSTPRRSNPPLLFDVGPALRLLLSKAMLEDKEIMKIIQNSLLGHMVFSKSQHEEESEWHKELEIVLEGVCKDINQNGNVKQELKAKVSTLYVEQRGKDTERSIEKACLEYQRGVGSLFQSALASYGHKEGNKGGRCYLWCLAASETERNMEEWQLPIQDIAR